MKKYLLIILALTVGVLSNSSSVQAIPLSNDNLLVAAIREGNLPGLKVLEANGARIESEELLQIARDYAEQAVYDATKDDAAKEEILAVCTYVQERVLEAFDAETARMNKEFLFVAVGVISAAGLYHLLFG